MPRYTQSCVPERTFPPARKTPRSSVNTRFVLAVMAKFSETVRKDMLSSQALPLVLRYEPVGTDLATVCQLLKTSKAMRAAVLQHCKGLLKLSFNIRSLSHAGHFVNWLLKNASLLGALELQSYGWYDTTQALQQCAEERLVWALQQHGTLALKDFASDMIGRQVSALLQSLSKSSLTALSLIQPMHEQELNILDSRLSEFSNLQRLSLGWLSSNGVLCLSEAVSALTSLTYLELTVETAFHTNLEHLLQLQRQLPGSLRHISLRAYPRSPYFVLEEVPIQLQLRPIQLQLRQLQGLQALDVTEVLESSVLPSQLNRLSCSDCRSMQPLQLCTQLQQLRIANCTAAADEWRKLSDLRALTNVEATMSAAAADAAAPGFRLRPLRSALLMLKIQAGGVRITAATIQNFKWLTALTELTIPVLADAPLPGSPEELGVVLQQLTALQRLELYADQDVSLFAPVVPALPANINEEIDYLMSVMENEHLLALSQLALQAAPNLNQAVTAGYANGHLSLYFAITADPAAVEQLHQYVQLMHGNQQQIPESGEHQDLQLLVEGIAVLPHLNSLKLKGCGLHMDAVQPLTRLSPLTRLTISGEGLDDMALIKLVLVLTNLKRLSLSNNREITDVSLMIISKVLSQLTELELTDCPNVTDRGVAELTGLRQLQVLETLAAPQVSQDAADEVLEEIAAGI